MNEAEQECRSGWRCRVSPRLLLALAVWLGAVAALLLPVGFLYGADGYFHLRVAREMWARGPFFQDFRAATESIWRVAYFDKDWLFHVYLMPFARWGLSGAKLAILGLNGLVVAAVWYFCRTLGLRRRLLVTVLLPFASVALFLERLILCRSYLLSLAILFFCLSWMLRRRAWWVGFGALVYAVAYTGHWQLLGLALVYDVAQVVLAPDGHRRPALRRAFPMTVAVLIGTVVGEFLHPNFPHNLEGLWIQNILIPRAYAHALPGGLFKDRPAELRPLPWLDFAANLGPVLAALAFTGLHAAVKRVRPCRRTLILAAWTAIYLVLTMRMVRFAEYLVPFAVVLVAFYIQRQRLAELLPPRASRVLAVALVVLLASLNIGWIWAFRTWPRLQFGGDQPEYTAAAEVIRREAKPGQIVFTTGWSEPAQLWYLCPEQRFLVFLDPYFFYYKDPDRYDLWMQTSHGQVVDPVMVIRDIFGARLVFTVQRPDRARIARELRAAPGVEVLYDSANGPLVLRLPPAPEK